VTEKTRWRRVSTFVYTLPEGSRPTAYGTFDTAFGAPWMVGSIILGRLYGISVGYLVLFAVAL
jgi:hypothetical protein